jgi:hypothetical protein
MIYNLSHWFPLDLLEDVGRELAAIGSHPDIARFRLISKTTARMGERYLFRCLRFDNMWNSDPHVRIDRFHQLIMAKPSLLHHTTHISLSPCHSEDWLRSPKLFDIVLLLAQHQRVQNIAFHRLHYSDPIDGSIVDRLLSPLAATVRSLQLDNIRSLPSNFFSKFPALHHLDIIGVRYSQPLQPLKSDHRPSLKSLHFGEKARYSFSSCEVSQDPLPLFCCLDRLQHLHCPGTEFHRDGLLFCEVPSFAASSLLSLTADVSGLFRK